MSGTDVRVVLVSVPEGAAGEALARGLVEDRLVACVNRVPGVRSIYRWNGEVCDDGECLLVMKTTVAALPALQKAIDERHPYDVPEVIALPVVAGSEAYLAWVRGEVGGE